MDEIRDFRLVTLLQHLSAPVEALANLTYLTEHEAEHGEKVRFYAELAEQQIAELRKIMLEAYDSTDRSSSGRR